ncbi:hypothetical protein F0562_003610 [Nyssa sinensis]|uniref:Uncharacterized protein n=1 Tax=Nyssa sinensis TaxID=561372 RepID=A0A5J5BZV2_9ASTE|nr:hypothetical protein F0562_003610 [Nyssa sinensis]
MTIDSFSCSATMKLPMVHGPVRFAQGSSKERISYGLNIDFDQVRVQVLGKESLPSLEGVFSIVQAEESRRGVMLDNPVNEGSAMNSTKLGHHTETNRDERQPNREGVWCTYCKKARHTKDTCWKLHGMPPNVGGKGGNRGGQP